MFSLGSFQDLSEKFSSFCFWREFMLLPALCCYANIKITVQPNKPVVPLFVRWVVATV